MQIKFVAILRPKNVSSEMCLGRLQGGSYTSDRWTCWCGPLHPIASGRQIFSILYP